MFGRKRGDSPAASEDEIRTHIMRTLNQIGSAGERITPENIRAAQTLAKAEACEALVTHGYGSAKNLRKTESAYDHVAGGLSAMFAPGGRFEGSTIAAQE